MGDGAMARERVRSFRYEEADAQVRRWMAGLAPFCAAPGGLVRALRQARKQARAGVAGYDPARHAALVRLAREKGSRRPEAAADTYRPSNSAVER